MMQGQKQVFKLNVSVRAELTLMMTMMDNRRVVLSGWFLFGTSALFSCHDDLQHGHVWAATT